MKIRFLKRNEIEEVSRIVGKNYSKKWELLSKNEIDAMFSHKALNPKYIVAEEDNKILGFAGYCTSWIDYQIKEIFWVNVLPEFQGKGIGHKMINEIIKKIKKEKSDYRTKLAILSCELKLVKFYEGFGFKKISSLKKNEFLMGLKL